MDTAQDALIRGCLAGDSRAWAELWRLYEGEIVRQMWRFTRDPAVCEELVQDVLVQLYRALPRYRRTGAPFAHWLRRIATRVGYQFWKNEARRLRHTPLDGFDASAPPENVGVLDPAVAGAWLHRLLAQLPPSDRLVLTLLYLEECGTKEIAEWTGWNRAGVKMRAMRARRRLRLMLEREMPPGDWEGLIHGRA